MVKELTDFQMHRRGTEAECDCSMEAWAGIFSLAFLAISAAGRSQARSILFVFGMPYKRLKNGMCVKHKITQIESSFTLQFSSHERGNPVATFGRQTRLGLACRFKLREVSDSTTPQPYSPWMS